MPEKGRKILAKQKERDQARRDSSDSSREDTCSLCNLGFLPNHIRYTVGCGCQFHKSHYEQWSGIHVGLLCPNHPMCILCKTIISKGQSVERLECGCTFHSNHYKQWSNENIGVICPTHKQTVPKAYTYCTLCDQSIKPNQNVHTPKCGCVFHQEHFDKWLSLYPGQFCPNHLICVLCDEEVEDTKVARRIGCGCLFHPEHYDEWSSEHPGMLCPVHYVSISEKMATNEKSPEPIKRRKHEKNVCFNCKSHIPLKELYVADCGCKFHKYHYVLWREDHLFCPLHFYCFHDEGECSDFGCEGQNQYEFTQKCFAPILADIPFDVGPDTRCTLYALPEGGDGRIRENWHYQGMGHVRVREYGGWEYLDFYPEDPDYKTRKYPIMHDMEFWQEGNSIFWEHQVKAQIDTLDMLTYTLCLRFTCIEYANDFMSILGRSIQFRKDRDELKKERAKGTCKIMKDLYALREKRAVEANKQFKKDRDADLGDYAPVHAKASENYNADAQRAIDYDVYDKQEADRMCEERREKNIRKGQGFCEAYSGCPPYLYSDYSDEESEEEDYDESAPGPSTRSSHQRAGGNLSAKHVPNYFASIMLGPNPLSAEELSQLYGALDLADESAPGPSSKTPHQKASGNLPANCFAPMSGPNWSADEIKQLEDYWDANEEELKGITWEDFFSSEENEEPDKF